ncbi:MAG: glycine cleavage system aminomethyltransferase GcvT [Xanthomonadales bacterium]|nr:glycine cleavage system aminomethyltransferase GcvT [Xanthomonadales bacterium]
MELSPLDQVHRTLGAKMVPFGGWEMPVAYPAGTLDEHLACRRDAVVFDVSHLGTVRVEGPQALGLLQAAFTNDLTKVAPGRAQYTHLLDPTDASVLDDIIVWWVADEVFDVMPNASNTDRVRAAIGGVETTHDRAVLAVQGPRAKERLAAVFADAAEVGRFRVQQLNWHGADCTVAGTGYTGEAGVEIAVPRAAAEDLWGAIVSCGIMPAGLGARDTLRLEAGMNLYGQDMDEDTTPLEAGLAWTVSFDEGRDFIGRAALEAQKAAGVPRRMVGLMLDDKGILRHGQRVETAAGDGVILSGTFAPTLGKTIAFARIPSGEPGAIGVDIRGRIVPAHIVKFPFVRDGKPVES